ncbi:MAG: Amidase [Bryobacterales bacterium]|nr:Amidase [Bryobacterales bacterium]
MPEDSICDLSAVKMRQEIAAGRLSAREVASAHLRRIAQVNPAVNAMVTVVAERALADAAVADERQARGEPLGLLHGLPVAHKDLHNRAGIRTTFGSPLFADFVPVEDSLIVERMVGAGAITLGKTNTPEFGAGSQTYNALFGATRNPYDLSKTCGGSTGGGAVALACGMAALCDGSDLGGSLRNPASFCNVVGLRPSAGRVPAWPAPMAWAPMSVEGPLARTVADVALFLQAISGPDERAPLACEAFEIPAGETLDADMKGIRIAWWRDLGGIPVEPEVRDITNAQRNVFEALGCIVEEAEPDWSGVDETFRTLRFWSQGLKLSDAIATQPELVKDTIRWEVEQSRSLTAADVGRAQIKHTEIYHRMRLFLQRYDFFVLPVSQVPPFPVDQLYPMSIDGTKLETYIDWMKSCYYISVTGVPAISVPAGFTEAGLPVGIQIAGRHRGEWKLLQLARAFEQAVNIKRKPQL